MDEAQVLAALGADRFSDYTVMGVIRTLKDHGWRIVKLKHGEDNTCEVVDEL